MRLSWTSISTDCRKAVPIVGEIIGDKLAAEFQSRAMGAAWAAVSSMVRGKYCLSPFQGASSCKKKAPFARGLRLGEKRCLWGSWHATAARLGVIAGNVSRGCVNISPVAVNKLGRNLEQCSSSSTKRRPRASYGGPCVSSGATRRIDGENCSGGGSSDARLVQCYALQGCRLILDKVPDDIGDKMCITNRSIVFHCEVENSAARSGPCATS